ncbi:MAG: hypothetical protein KH452_11680 [Clostridiales bacterium]|nr:hypothetical protein [Clostridiales bacterium]
MTTFEKILEIFRDYLLSESCVEVLPTKWGYVRLYYEEPYGDSFDAVLCRTPEELFEVLLNHALAEREYWLSKEASKSDREMSVELKKTYDLYISRFQKGGV